LWGQAFPSAQGEIDVGLGYQYTSVRDHTYSDGQAFDRGHIRDLGITPDITIGLTDRASLRVGLPLAIGKYVGAFPHPSILDDGNYHATFADFNTSFRYNLTRTPLFLTPEFTAIIPSHQYVSYAHSAAGRDLREFRTGINVGRRLDPLLPKAVVQGRYYYSFVEQILGIHHNLSGGDYEFDYFLTPRLTLLGLGTWQYTYGGLNQPCCLTLAQAFTPEELPHHDQLLAAKHHEVGGGLAIAVSDSLTMYASALHAVYSANGHKLFLGLNMGVYYTFRPGGAEK
jgi:hypothetical protein